MATKYVCDRCAKETTTRNEIRNVTVPMLNGYRSVSDDEMSKDLCENCVVTLHDFLKGNVVAAVIKRAIL